SALSKVQACWPKIKVALEAKKGVDDAFKSAVVHEGRAFDLSKEITDLEAKSHPIGDLMYSRKKNIRELRAQMDQEFCASTAAESRTVEMSQQPSPSVPQPQSSLRRPQIPNGHVLAAVTAIPELATWVDDLRASRSVYDLAKSRYLRYKKAEALCKEILEDSEVSWRKLLEEYPGYPRGETAASPAGRHPGPDENHEVTLAHIRKELGKFRGDINSETMAVAEAVTAIWEVTVPAVVGRMGAGRAEMEEMRRWMPDIALSTNAFKL
ncbi:hypothetical protein HDU96_006676, partial [Phlyctochytrium bullatum]